MSWLVYTTDQWPVTSDHDCCFLKSLIGWELCGIPTSYYTKLSKVKMTMGDHVERTNEKVTWLKHENLHV